MWSNADHLYDDFPRHWSGSVVYLSGMIRIDGKLYRLVITVPESSCQQYLFHVANEYLEWIAVGVFTLCPSLLKDYLMKVKLSYWIRNRRGSSRSLKRVTQQW